MLIRFGLFEAEYGPARHIVINFGRLNLPLFQSGFNVRSSGPRRWQTLEREERSVRFWYVSTVAHQAHAIFEAEYGPARYIVINFERLQSMDRHAILHEG